MDPTSFPLNPSQFLGASTPTQISDTPAAEGSSSRSEPFVLHSPCPVVHREAIADNLGRDACSIGHVRPHAGKLELLTLDKWNKNKTYNKEPLSCLHYLIKWKVTLNNKLISKDTKPNLVLAPRFY
jgi:hypothetical protein